MRGVYKEGVNVIFWTSDKAGSNFIRSLYMHCLDENLQLDIYDSAVQSNIALTKNLVDSSINILFIRNPYKRVVSAYLSGFWDAHLGIYNVNKRLKESLTFYNV